MYEFILTNITIYFSQINIVLYIIIPTKYYSSLILSGFFYKETKHEKNCNGNIIDGFSKYC